MEEKKKDYQKIICTICKNKDVCNQDKMKIYKFDEKISMRCINYEYNRED